VSLSLVLWIVFGLFASNVVAHDFQDVAAFLRADGQRGPQRKILREGTYAFNTAEFVVINTPPPPRNASADANRKRIEDDMKR
jgi:hypothetical protein